MSNQASNTVSDSSSEGVSLRLKITAIAIIVLLIFGIGYAGYTYIQDAPLREFEVAVAGLEIEQIADMENEERKAFFEKMKLIRDKMSEAQKKINDDKNIVRMTQQFNSKFSNFFAATPEEQRASLDKDIDRMGNIMKGFLMGKGGAPGAGGFGPPGAGFGSKGGAAGDSKNNSPNTSGNANTAGAGNANTAGAGNANTAGAGNANTAGAGNANTAGAGNANKGKGPPSPEERNRRVSDGLDKSTPEMRAQMTEYWVRMNQRVKERGFQMIPFLGGFGGPKPK